jgi:hypothetical protein
MKGVAMKTMRIIILLLICFSLLYSPSKIAVGQETNTLNVLYLPLVMKPCVKPILISPENSAQLDTLIPSFTFEIPQVSHSILILLEISTDPGFGSTVYTMGGYLSGGSNTWQPFNNLEPGTNYYWRITADCGNSVVCHSDIRSFTTGSLGEILPSPILLSPEDGSTTSSTQVTFDWEDVPGAVEYVILYQVQGSSWLLIYVTDSTITRNLQAGKTYNWYVQAMNDYAYGANSDLWTFTTPGP